MIFFCRNNGYAISTPTCDQFSGDGIISRASGYGMHSIRVDGNDIFAVKEATSAARKLALEQNVPVLIEAMSYRRGHHSTSDDSTRYRSAAEIKFWGEYMNPITRLRKFMLHKGWWDAQSEVAMKDAERIAVLRALDIAEKRPKPHLRALFEDVYAELPPNLQEQQAQLLEHIAKYPQHYNSNGGH
jgi:2-oxoisovalerate dehydrogenase E1 component alpha subunit